MLRLGGKGASPRIRNPLNGPSPWFLKGGTWNLQLYWKHYHYLFHFSIHKKVKPLHFKRNRTVGIIEYHMFSHTIFGIDPQKWRFP
jgi:hypothetical protein